MLVPDYETLPGEREIWRGRQWAVTSECIQRIGRPYVYYWIALDRLHEGCDGNHSMLEHVADKEWVEFDDLVMAWLIACAYSGTRIENIGSILQRASAKAAQRNGRRA